MRVREGFGLVSLMAVVGFLWGLQGLARVPAPSENRARTVDLGPPPDQAAVAPRPRSRLPWLDWGPRAALDGALRVGLDSGLRSFRSGDGALEEPRPLAPGPPPTGWAVARASLQRPVAEPPLWLTLSLAGGALVSRRRRADARDELAPRGPLP